MREKTTVRCALLCNSFLVLVSFIATLSATVYKGTSSLYYTNKNVVFHNNDSAVGEVLLNGGFTILSDATGTFSIGTPVYGPIDLRFTGTLRLGTDLILDATVTFSRGGNIWGNGHVIFLTGNTRLPDNSIFTFVNNTIIDGQGHDLILGKYSQLVIENSSTVTFKNLIIKNDLNTISCPPIRCAGWASKACFDNVIFAFNDDFAFRDGQMFVHNDVYLTGTSKFSYRSARPSYITQHSNLIFDKSTIFEYYPSTTNNQLIQMADKTSTLIFDDSTLLTTHTGIRLTKGNLYFDNKVTLSSVDDTVLTGLNQLAIGFNFTTNARAAIWSPDGKYLAVGGDHAYNDLIIYSWNGLSLTVTASKSFGAYVYGLDWSPDGKYLVVGGDNGSNDLIVYEWNGSILTTRDTKSFGAFAITPNWSSDGKYLAVAGQYDYNDLIIYNWNGTALTVTTSKSFGTTAYSSHWSPDGKYLAVGGLNGANDLIVYEWNGSTLTAKDTRSFSDRALGVRWSHDGKYLAVGGADATYSLVLYEWNGSTLTERAMESFGGYARGIRWSPDGKYLAVGGSYGYNDFVIYKWDGLSLTVTTSKSFGSYAFSVDWRSDGKYLAVGGQNGSNDVVVYGVDYKYDTSPLSFNNGITFGDSALGSAYDLDVYSLADARVNVYGKLWHDSLNSWIFDSRDSYLSLNCYDSKFKITNAECMSNWKQQHIIKSSEDNSLFLQDNQVWGASSDFLAPEETFEFMDDLIIPDNQIVQLSSNAVIDGQGHDLILGKRAQLIVDNNTTVTFKNLTVKNTLNTADIPPLWGQSFSSAICLDNVTFSLNNDYTFTSGKLFFHNDVVFTGTSKFSYRSLQPSYIAQHSNVTFAPHTTFEYYPYSTDNSLINMADRTSGLIFDGSTLQTTHTGIRLTKGSVYFDNNVTLSSSIANTMPQAFSNGIIFGDSTLNSTHDLAVSALAAARINLYGNLWHDSLNSWTFDSRDSYLSLNRYDSKFKITNADSMDNWKKQHIIKASEENTIFLQDNQVWEANTDYNLAPEETFEFMNDLIIPDNQLVKLSSNAVIDGQGHNLILGKYAQLLVDSGITVTFKNMTVKNTLNTISCPPIRCMDWYSKACLDNVTLSFNDDFVFRNGQMFVNNDLIITGTSKFSYRSVRPSYIAQQSNLIFDPNTTFEFYPSTTDNQLIQMADKTSGIIFDGSSLQTTHTGIRLTKGSVYFDNKVTLSSAGDNVLTPFYISSFPVNSSEFKTLGVAFSPDGRFLAMGKNANDGGGNPRNAIYKLQGNTFTFVCYIDNTPYVTSKQISWSPDGKYLAVSKNGVSTLYSFNGSSCSYICSIGSSADTWWTSWSPDGKYLAKANTDSSECDVYNFDGTSCTLTCSVESGVQMWSIDWSPNGKYLATGEYATPCKIYRFDESMCKFVCNINDSPANTKQASWGPDGRFIALGNYNQPSSVYHFNGRTASVVATTPSKPTCRASWSPNGKYIVFPNSFDTTSIYSFNGSSLVKLLDLNDPSANTDANCAAWTPDGTVVVVGIYPNSSYAYEVSYQFDTSPQGFINSIVFGNSTLGSAYDLDVNVLAGARVNVFGNFMYDNVN